MGVVFLNASVQFDMGSVKDIWGGTGGKWSMWCKPKFPGALPGNGYIVHFGLAAGGAAYRTLINSAGDQVGIRVATSTTDCTRNSATSFVAINTSYNLGVSCAGTVAGNIPAASFRIFKGSGTGTMTEAAYVSDADGGVPVATDGKWEWGNRDGLDRDWDATNSDCVIWRGVELTPAQFNLLDAGADPGSISPANIVHAPNYIGGNYYDPASGVLGVLKAGSTSAGNADVPHFPVTKDFVPTAYPLRTDASLKWFVTDGDQETDLIASVMGGSIVATAATSNNVRALRNLAGTGACLYRNSTSDSPLLDTEAVNGQGRWGRSLAFSLNTAGASGAVLSVNNNGSLSNAGLTIEGIFWAVTINASARSLFNMHGVQIGADANGAITVTVAAATYTPLLSNGRSVRLLGQPQPFICTISEPGGLSAKVITLYTPRGVATVSTAAYTASSTTATGMGTAAVANQNYNGMKRFVWLSRAITAAEATLNLAYHRTIAKAPAAYRGRIVFAGSSTIGGSNTAIDACQTIGYQLDSNGTAEVMMCGYAQTGTADMRVIVAAGAAYQLGESVTQAGSGLTGSVIYQNGNNIYLIDTNGVAPDAINPLHGVTSGVDRIPSSSSVGVVGVNGLRSGTRLSQLFVLLSDSLNGVEPMTLVINNESNPVNNAWPVADIVEIDKSLVSVIKASFPQLQVWMMPNIPRSGGAGNSHQAYNALLKSTTGYWDRVIPSDLNTAIDFLDGSGVDDDGVFDYGAGGIYATRNGVNDGIHGGKYVASRIADAIDTLGAGLFGGGSGLGGGFRGSFSGGGGGRIRDFRSRSLVR